ncbi:hypothetical protein ACFVUS_31115 [Nocardia sp. NPDC058058]|uniref:hypothetical protein n=1 Tax=Nocardia sp. NPDC058058 TaxID=3346317 RepID=UPI0036DE2CE0
MADGEPVWESHARKALRAAVDQDAERERVHVGEMVRLGPPSVLHEAALVWIGELFALIPPPPGGLRVPDTSSAQWSFLSESQWWALKLVSACSQRDADTVHQLLDEAGTDPDTLTDRVGRVLALVALKLRHPLNSPR